MKVLIIEDEKKIGELISRLIDWERLGLTLLGYVCDGKEGYEAICEKRPEIVITDIRMPSMTGLDIIKMARRQNLKCHFVVISGYQQFEYAKTALQFQVEDYLLKPINQEELYLTLEKITTAIKKKKEEEIRQNRIHKDLETRTEKLKKQLLLDFLQTPDKIREMVPEDIMVQYFWDLRDGIIRFLIIKADCSQRETRQFLPLILGRCQKLVEQSLIHYAEEMQCSIQKDKLIVLYKIGKDLREKDEGQITECARTLNDIILSYEGLELSLCPGQWSEGVEGLKEAYESAVKSMQYRIIKKTNNLSLAPGDLQVCRMERMLPTAAKSELQNNIELGNLEDIDNSIRSMFRELEKEGLRMAGPGVLYLLLDEIIQISKKTLEEFEQYRDCVPAFHDTIEQINHAASITALLNNFRKEYLNELQTCFDNSGQGGNRPIRSALQFIAVHYAQPLTLEMVSEAVHLSPNYFSALFKREMDCSFIEYLTTYRLDQAKKLLRETNYGIAEIAERTGYADARYFSRLFSKTFGITPNRYRKL